MKRSPVLYYISIGSLLLDFPVGKCKIFGNVDLTFWVESPTQRIQLEIRPVRLIPVLLIRLATMYSIVIVFGHKKYIPLDYLGVSLL
jgi:hypothetical protein